MIRSFFAVLILRLSRIIRAVAAANLGNHRVGRGHAVAMGLVRHARRALTFNFGQRSRDADLDNWLIFWFSVHGYSFVFWFAVAAACFL